MMKKLMALLMAAMLMLSSFGAAVAEEADVVLATAYDGEVSVMMSEVKAEFDEMLQAYIAYYAQYGYEMDEYDTEFQNSVAQETVQMKLSQKVAEYHANATGYELTQEKDEAYQAEALAALADCGPRLAGLAADFSSAERQTMLARMREDGSLDALIAKWNLTDYS